MVHSVENILVAIIAILLIIGVLTGIQAGYIVNLKNKVDKIYNIEYNYNMELNEFISSNFSQ